jgi:hypothetical protein
MKVFKGYVCNRTRPEASMAKGDILDETIGLVTEYMREFVHVKQQVWDANEEGVSSEVLEGSTNKFLLDVADREHAHQ